LLACFLMSAGRRRSQKKGKKQSEEVAESPQRGSQSVAGEGTFPTSSLGFMGYVPSPGPHPLASPLPEEGTTSRRLFAENAGGGGQDVPEQTTTRDLGVNPSLELPRKKAGESAKGRSSEHAPVCAQVLITGHNLAARDQSFLHGSSSDPYLLFTQAGMLIAQTEVIEHNLNPVWQPLTVTLALGSNVSIQCMDKDEGSQDDVVGEAEVTAARLLTPGTTIPLLFEQEDAGVLRVLDVHLISPQRIGKSEPSQPHRSEGPQRIGHGCTEAVSLSEAVTGGGGHRGESREHEEIARLGMIPGKGGHGGGSFNQRLGMMWDHAIADSKGEIWDHELL
jgi:hypothetical protein